MDDAPRMSRRPKPIGPRCRSEDLVVELAWMSKLDGSGWINGELGSMGWLFHLLIHGIYIYIYIYIGVI